MKLDFDKTELLEIITNFYELTGIQTVLFDSDYTSLLRYPDTHCPFCTAMKASSTASLLCNQSDHAAFEVCQKTKKAHIYHCHAGLIEVCSPLIYEGNVIGYLVFGHISDNPNPVSLNMELRNYAYSILENAPENEIWSKDIPIKTEKQIRAATKIMEACTYYVILKDTIRPHLQNFEELLDAYIRNHYSEPINVDQIARHFGVSRSKLYRICSDSLPVNLTDYICDLKMRKAEQLLSNTNQSISDIADACGFDYNYFCRVFKKTHHVTAREYRKQVH